MKLIYVILCCLFPPLGIAVLLWKLFKLFGKMFVGLSVLFLGISVLGLIVKTLSFDVVVSVLLIGLVGYMIYTSKVRHLLTKKRI